MFEDLTNAYRNSKDLSKFKNVSKTSQKGLFKIFDENGEEFVYDEFFATKEDAQNFIDENKIENVTIRELYKLYSVICYNYRGENYSAAQFSDYASARKYADSLDEKSNIACEWVDAPVNPGIDVKKEQEIAFIKEVFGVEVDDPNVFMDKFAESVRNSNQ